MQNDATLARVSAAQVRRFLEELVNLSDDLKAAERFKVRFARFLPWAHLRQQAVTLISEGEVPPNAQRMRMIHYDELLPLRDALRSVWVTPDLATKEWRILSLGSMMTFLGSVYFSAEPRPLTPFGQALVYFFRSASTTRYCTNPNCHTPYFFATRRGQKYCSEVCALPAQREYKRRWWRQHGSTWRKSRGKHVRPKPRQ